MCTNNPTFRLKNQVKCLNKTPERTRNRNHKFFQCINWMKQMANNKQAGKTTTKKQASIIFFLLKAVQMRPAARFNNNKTHILKNNDFGQIRDFRHFVTLEHSILCIYSRLKSDLGKFEQIYPWRLYAFQFLTTSVKKKNTDTLFVEITYLSSGTSNTDIFFEISKSASFTTITIISLYIEK